MIRQRQKEAGVPLMGTEAFIAIHLGDHFVLVTVSFQKMLVRYRLYDSLRGGMDLAGIKYDVERY